MQQLVDESGVSFNTKDLRATKCSLVVNNGVRHVPPVSKQMSQKIWAPPNNSMRQSSNNGPANS